MHALTHLIVCTKNYLLNWKSSSLTPLETDIRNTEFDISLLEVTETSNKPLDGSSLALISLCSRHSTLLKQNSIRWEQRARLMWLKNGDMNTNFFRKHACIRNHKNRIFTIMNDTGIIHIDNLNIGNCFIDFHSRLWTSRVSVLDLANALHRNLETLNDSDRTLLIRPMAMRDIFLTLKS